MNKSLILTAILFLIIINPISASLTIIPNIESPNCSKDINVCAEISGLGISDSVILSCTVNNFEGMNIMLLDSGESYCASFQGATTDAIDGQLIQCMIIIGNGGINIKESFNTTFSCHKATCGDGILDAGEECDDGNNIDSDECTNKCMKKKVRCNSGSSITKYEMDNDCEPRWKCSGWSECFGDVKNRECIDLNNCDYAYNMPPAIVGCEIISDAKIEVKNYDFSLWILSVLILLLILFILIQKSKK